MEDLEAEQPDDELDTLNDDDFDEDFDGDLDDK
jgi:hypothetical protein